MSSRLGREFTVGVQVQNGLLVSGKQMANKICLRKCQVVRASNTHGAMHSGDLVQAIRQLEFLA